jgi:glycosyltransferase involved in cell wall biosynthesis
LRNEYPASWVDKSHRNWKKKKDIFSDVPNMTIVTPSKWLKSWVKESFLKEYPVEVINNGIDTSQFCVSASTFKEKNGFENKFILLGVSTSWDEMKGYSDYIKIAELLGNDYKVILVGLTKEQLEKLPKNIFGIERTSSVRELAEIYTAADLFLNLSYCENYPTVNLEALACGTPVLTYKTGGSPEIVQDYGGVVVEQGDIMAVINQIKMIRNVGNESVSVNKNLLDKQEAMHRYLDLY